MRPAYLLPSLLAALFSCSLAWAEDIGDIAPGVANGKVVIGAFDDGSNTYTPPPLSAFDFEFGGDIPFQPYATMDPGFVANDAAFPSSAAKFPANTRLSFSILSNLTYWNGLGAEDFQAAPVGTSLYWEGISDSLTLGPDGPPEPSGFSIALSDSTGFIHQHMGAIIQSTTGDPLPGFYRFYMDLHATGYVDSDSLSVTYALTPEPASLAVLAVGGGLLLLRRPRSTAQE